MKSYHRENNKFELNNKNKNKIKNQNNYFRWEIKLFGFILFFLVAFGFSLIKSNSEKINSSIINKFDYSSTIFQDPLNITNTNSTKNSSNIIDNDCDRYKIFNINKKFNQK